MKTDLSNSTLKTVLHEVERDEAAAIDALCGLLEWAEESREFDCLPRIREVVKEWQNQPPRAIVTELQRICKELGCPTPDNA